MPKGPALYDPITHPDRATQRRNIVLGLMAQQSYITPEQATAGKASLLVTATLDDALGVTERPNVPGTIDERPNWSLALPEPLERLEALPLPRRIAGVLARRP